MELDDTSECSSNDGAEWGSRVATSAAWGSWASAALAATPRAAVVEMKGNKHDDEAPPPALGGRATRPAFPPPPLDPPAPSPPPVPELLLLLLGVVAELEPAAAPPATVTADLVDDRPSVLTSSDRLRAPRSAGGSCSGGEVGDLAASPVVVARGGGWSVPRCIVVALVLAPPVVHLLRLHPTAVCATTPDSASSRAAVPCFLYA